MIVMNVLRKLKKMRITCLFLFCLLAMTPATWATYEVEVSSITPNVLVSNPTKWTEDLMVYWEGPTIGAGDTLNGFIYKWSASNNALNDDEFNISTGGDGFVRKDVPYTVTKNKADLANLDSGDFLYFHIKTFYLVGSTQTYSTDVIKGPFMIDNVAPTGTVRVVDANGSDITETSNIIVQVKLGSSADTAKVYLNETPNILTSSQLTYSTDDAYTFLNTTPGVKTVYAWFEDAVGNLTPEQNPAIDTVTLLASINISPNTATLDLAAGATQVFRVEGTSATYNWTIINQVPETTGTVAQFSGDSAAVNWVTVQGLVKGTFQLQAVPTSGTGTLTSGTISVVQATISKVFDLITTLTTSTNTVGFIFENTGITTAHGLGTAVGSCTQVAKWNALTQSYLSHRMQFPTLNDFTLTVGEAYFVTVTDAHQFTLSGKAPTSQTQTLITTATTNTNAIGVPNSKSSILKAHALGLDIGNCSQVSKWNASTQSYLSHRMQFPTLNDFDVTWGEGYFITVTQVTNWPW